MSEGAVIATPAPWQPQPFAVARVRRESHDTTTLHLQPARGSEAAHDARAILPGQFNMLYLFGQGEAAVSVSGVSRRSGFVHHTVKAVGPLTSALNRLKVGDLVGVRGPFGTGWPMTALQPNLLLVAGGIGMAPIRSVLRALTRRRNRFGRIDLVYGSRRPADILYRPQLERWRDKHNVNVHVTVDHGDADWRGPVGFVTAPLAQLDLDTGNTTALVCGPEVMMRHCLTQLITLGLAPANIFLSMERSMRCAIGVCGHCQWGPDFVCRQGPVFCAQDVMSRLQLREL